MESEGIKNGENQGGSGNSGFKRKPVIILIGLLVIAFLVWYMGSGTNEQKNSTQSGIGEILVTMTTEEDGEYFIHPDRKRTLYISDSECVGDCVGEWIPYYASERVDLGALSTIVREDNQKLQYAWAGSPIYMYAADAEGEAFGDDEGDVWHIARP